MVLGGRGRLRGGLEFVADDGSGRLVSIIGEVGGGVFGVSGAVARALALWLGARAVCADVGFGGFRFDFVRGYAPEYTEEYVKETTSRGDFCVGENWVDLSWEGSFLNYNQDGPRGKLVEWLAATHGTCALFDFPTIHLENATRADVRCRLDLA